MYLSASKYAKIFFAPTSSADSNPNFIVFFAGNGVKLSADHSSVSSVVSVTTGKAARDAGKGKGEDTSLGLESIITKQQPPVVAKAANKNGDVAPSTTGEDADNKEGTKDTSLDLKSPVNQPTTPGKTKAPPPTPGAMMKEGTLPDPPQNQPSAFQPSVTQVRNQVKETSATFGKDRSCKGDLARLKSQPQQPLGYKKAKAILKQKENIRKDYEEVLDKSQLRNVKNKFCKGEGSKSAQMALIPGAIVHIEPVYGKDGKLEWKVDYYHKIACDDATKTVSGSPTATTSMTDNQLNLILRPRYYKLSKSVSRKIPMDL